MCRWHVLVVSKSEIVSHRSDDSPEFANVFQGIKTTKQFDAGLVLCVAPGWLLISKAEFPLWWFLSTTRNSQWLILPLGLWLSWRDRPSVKVMHDLFTDTIQSQRYSLTVESSLMFSGFGPPNCSHGCPGRPKFFVLVISQPFQMRCNVVDLTIKSINSSRYDQSPAKKMEKWLKSH